MTSMARKIWPRSIHTSLLFPSQAGLGHAPLPGGHGLAGDMELLRKLLLGQSPVLSEISDVVGNIIHGEGPPVLPLSYHSCLRRTSKSYLPGSFVDKNCLFRYNGAQEGFLWSLPQSPASKAIFRKNLESPGRAVWWRSLWPQWFSSLATGTSAPCGGLTGFPTSG